MYVEFDTNKDGTISEEEAAKVDSIKLVADWINDKFVGISTKITSLQGIEYFPNIKKLVCRDSKIAKIDVSNNLALEVCIARKISSPPLMSADVWPWNV